jgi:hypothetical protein
MHRDLDALSVGPGPSCTGSSMPCRLVQDCHASGPRCFVGWSRTVMHPDLDALWVGPRPSCIRVSSPCDAVQDRHVLGLRAFVPRSWALMHPVHCLAPPGTGRAPSGSLLGSIRYACGPRRAEIPVRPRHPCRLVEQCPPLGHTAWLVRPHDTARRTTRRAPLNRTRGAVRRAAPSDQPDNGCRLVGQWVPPNRTTPLDRSSGMACVTTRHGSCNQAPRVALSDDCLRLVEQPGSSRRGRV